MTSLNSSNTEYELSIVVPVHNEEELLEPIVKEITLGLEARSSNFEIILVENGSTDQSATIADNLASIDSRISVLHLPQASYGDALGAGLRATTGETIGHFSVDIVDFEFLDNALHELKSTDLVLGSKFVGANQDVRPLLKRVGSQVFHQISRRVLRIPVADTHGIKLMKSKAAMPVLNKISRGGEIFDDEFVLRAAQAGVTMLEIPFHCEEIRPSRTSALRRAIKAMRQLTGLRLALWKERFRS